MSGLMGFSLAVVVGWGFLGLGYLTAWRWPFVVAMVELGTTLLIASWKYNRRISDGTGG